MNTNPVDGERRDVKWTRSPTCCSWARSASTARSLSGTARNVQKQYVMHSNKGILIGLSHRAEGCKPSFRGRAMRRRASVHESIGNILQMLGCLRTESRYSLVAPKWLDFTFEQQISCPIKAKPNVSRLVIMNRQVWSHGKQSAGVTTEAVLLDKSRGNGKCLSHKTFASSLLPFPINLPILRHIRLRKAFPPIISSHSSTVWGTCSPCSTPCSTDTSGISTTGAGAPTTSSTNPSTIKPSPANPSTTVPPELNTPKTPTSSSSTTPSSSSSTSALGRTRITTASITCIPTGSTAARCWDHRAFAPALPALPRAGSIARRGASNRFTK
ncbi:predicted protein [Histoplasma capsulatum G186AR]|uniref:Uncharacterized protein n=1 Tax=Ajellomyces capsulatus (strain G186AR / H82 / ATCC MYA-2454 / RMSCC 2432) TaxID=447093 RepID=C0NEN8_AJECG|nr:uncharacterized protein HCBG_01354 [Histoplasma capsulatum G186AR]EEH09709.1 predicted protein [Histoplasma capsulatum G186AR]